VEPALHHEVAIQYFQATSAIIPTLAIALAVSGSVVKVQEGKNARTWFLAENRSRNIFLALGLMVLFAMLWLVLYNSIAPMLEAMGKTMADHAGWIAAGGVGALGIVFAAVFLVLGGSMT
jgi:hypothetical protein